MDSLIQMSNNETATSSGWTEEKHVHFLNTMEDSFVRTMLRRYQHLRLDRHLPDTSESTLDSKPTPPNRKPKNKKLAPTSSYSSSDSTGPRGRRTRRRSSQPSNSSQEQVVPQLENETEADACVVGENDEQRRNV